MSVRNRKIHTYPRDQWKSPQSGFEFRIAVSQFETVQVKAGSFKAFKIEVFKAYPGVLLNVYWYSPQVKWFAKSRI